MSMTINENYVVMSKSGALRIADGTPLKEWSSKLLEKVNEMEKEIEQLKEYIVEYELLGGEVKPMSQYEDRLSIL